VSRVDVRPKVLIVDDVTKNIQLVANFLKQAGYEINYSISGINALNHVKNESFDLILLDIMMPEMDGFEVCQKLKENPSTRDIPVIFLTAKTDIESITKAFEVGGVDFVTKPFNRAELLARVNTHLELMSQRKSLKDLNATKDKFFSIIAHDLKSPLNQLIGLSELINTGLKNGSVDESVRMADLMSDASKSAKALLENLLEWSRSQTGTIKFTPNPLDLHVLTREIVELHEQHALQKKVKLKAEVPENYFAFADANMIKTVLRNLVSNGIKFTNQGGNVTLSVEKENGNVIYSVADSGIGLKPEDIGKLFRIDINPNSIGNSKEKGTGLGLILCKEFVEINGGKIWVESKWREGTTFRFSLPVKN
jgi:signal transduction histidine kinase